MTAHTAWDALRRAAPALLVLAAVAIHGRLAALRSENLLEHDESISLLIAAGKADKTDPLYAAKNRVAEYRAGDLQDWLRPGAESGLTDVFKSAAKHDIHPPLYGLLLHAIQRAGISSHVYLRLIGVALLLLAAWLANRFVWPGAPAYVRWLATWLLIASPVSLEIATEFRQYSLVILGLVLAQAALIAHWQGNQPDRKTVVLLAAAPVLLCWSQLGTAFWLLTALPLILVPCVRKQTRASRRLLLAAAAAAIPLSILAVWWMTQAVGPNPIPPVTAERFYEGGLQRMISNVGRAHFCLPISWQSGSLPTIVGVGVFLGVGILAFATRGVECWIYSAAIVWSLLWLALIAAAILPIHATHAEHLQVLILCIPMILARAACAPGNLRRRRAATAILVVAAALQVGGIKNLFEGRVERAAMVELHEADRLLSTSHLRGYLLPIVAALRPETPVVVGPPRKLSAEWQAAGPPAAERLALLYVAEEGDEPAYLELLARLFEDYRDVITAYEERSWKLIALSHRRAVGQKSRQ